MEKKTWDDNRFTKKIRIKESHLETISRIRGKRSRAAMLEKIIDYYIKHKKL